jgi:uncharacterized repeat protein (TIGR02543 family)
MTPTEFVFHFSFLPSHFSFEIKEFFMKNTIRVFGFAAIVAVIVFGIAAGFTACVTDTTEPDTPTFTVTFVSNGGSNVPPQTVAQGFRVTKPDPNPTRSGDWFFVGWFKESSLTTEWDFAGDTVTGKMTLYAKWTQTASTVLTGDITIELDTETVCVDTELTASYSGSEAVTFQWKKDGGNVGTATATNPNKYTPTEAGNYTVTVSATDYDPKTAEVEVEVTDHVWGDWDEDAEDYVAPTCEEPGTGSRVCTVCGVADPSTVIPIDPDGHDWEWVATSTSFIEEYEETGTCKHDPSYTKTRTVDPLPITTSANWATARSQISGKSNVGEYTLTIEGDVGVASTNVSNFGTTAVGSSLSVTLKGSGKLYLNNTNRGVIFSVSAQGKRLSLTAKT